MDVENLRFSDWWPSVQFLVSSISLGFRDFTEAFRDDLSSIRTAHIKVFFRMEAKDSKH